MYPLSVWLYEENIGEKELGTLMKKRACILGQLYRSKTGHHLDLNSYEKKSVEERLRVLWVYAFGFEADLHLCKTIRDLNMVEWQSVLSASIF